MFGIGGFCAVTIHAVQFLPNPPHENLAYPVLAALAKAERKVVVVIQIFHFSFLGYLTRIGAWLLCSRRLLNVDLNYCAWKIDRLPNELKYYFAQTEVPDLKSG